MSPEKQEKKLTYQDKLEKIMQHIQDEGLWTNTFSDIIIGSAKSLPTDVGNHIDIALPEEKHYNSVLLYTMLTTLQQPRGTLMYQGAPGIGKTTVAEYVGHFIFDIPLEDILDASVYCNPELTEEKMIARLCTAALMKEGKEKVIPRSFIGCPVHILDEVNRLPPDKTDILYQAIDRGFAKYMDERLELNEGPIFATANYADPGNFAMTAPFMDRFELSVKVPSPNCLDLECITDATAEDLKRALNLEKSLKLSKDDRDKIWKEMQDVIFSKEARNYIHYVASQVNFCMMGVSPKYSSCAPAFMTKGNCETQRPDALCKDCHFGTHSDEAVCRLTQNELSVRAIKSVYKYSRALAWFLGKEEVTTEVVKNVFPFVARHRLLPTRSAFNVDSALKNDSSGLVNLVLERCENSFNRAGPIFEAYGSIVNAFEKVEAGEMKSEDLIKVEEHGQEEISQHDDPVKFALACWLQKIHHYIIKTYKK